MSLCQRKQAPRVALGGNGGYGHRIIEYLKLKRTHKDLGIQLPAPCRTSYHWTWWVRASSGHPCLAEGLRCALWWGRWIQLGSAVSDTRLPSLSTLQPHGLLQAKPCQITRLTGPAPIRLAPWLLAEVTGARSALEKFSQTLVSGGHMEGNFLTKTLILKSLTQNIQFSVF